MGCTQSAPASEGSAAKDAPPSPQQGHGSTAADSLTRCIDKYVCESGALSIEDPDRPGSVCLMFVPSSNKLPATSAASAVAAAAAAAPANDSDPAAVAPAAAQAQPVPSCCLCFAYFNTKAGLLYALEIRDEEHLLSLKKAGGISTSWGHFIKSVAAYIIKHKAKFDVSGKGVTLKVSVTVSKTPTEVEKPFAFTLPLVAPTYANQFRYFVEPSVRIVQNRRTATDRKDKEKKLEEIAVTIANAQARAADIREREAELRKSVVEVRAKLDKQGRQVLPDNVRAQRAERRYLLRLTHEGEKIANTELDAFYEKGQPPSTALLHLPRAVPHAAAKVPMPSVLGFTANNNNNNNNVTPAWLTAPLSSPLLRALGGVASEFVSAVAGASAAADNFSIKESASSNASYAWKKTARKYNIGDTSDRQVIEGILRVLSNVDDWDFDVFELDKVSNGNALFCVTLALLMKLDLLRALKIDVAKFVHFVAHLQAGYHPNPYHNATHAADVTQVNYFLLTKGGLAEKCKLSKEELFASVLAGAVHDFDHPGFNNSFHTRTNSYLSTLYNDRSVLENHHLACVFEMMQSPKLNFMADTSENMRRDIRDTMVEMVLATDMGNHQKIFDSFRQKLGDVTNWSEKPDDRRLALSMSIKMADVSNTCRPKELYLPWVQCLTQEFYHQGDHERHLGTPISPFMDREKHNDLPRGQISFINFVIMPMFEVAAQFLPGLRFCTDVCRSNKEYWQAAQVARP